MGNDGRRRNRREPLGSERPVASRSLSFRTQECGSSAKAGDLARHHVQTKTRKHLRTVLPDDRWRESGPRVLRHAGSIVSLPLLSPQLIRNQQSSRVEIPDACLGQKRLQALRIEPFPHRAAGRSAPPNIDDDIHSSIANASHECCGIGAVTPAPDRENRVEKRHHDHRMADSRC